MKTVVENSETIIEIIKRLDNKDISLYLSGGSDGFKIVIDKDLITIIKRWYENCLYNSSKSME